MQLETTLCLEVISFAIFAGKKLPTAHFIACLPNFIFWEGLKIMSKLPRSLKTDETRPLAKFFFSFSEKEKGVIAQVFAQITN